MTEAQVWITGEDIILSFKLILAQEFNDVTVKVVGAGLGDGIHYRAPEFSVFGVNTVGDQPKFLDGIQVGNQSGTHVAAFADVAAVHQEGVRRLALAIDRDIARIL